VRNRGEWFWRVRLHVKNWRSVWGAGVGFLDAFRLVASVIGQTLLGPFHFWTRVDYVPGELTVRHSAAISKWGMTFLRSEKVMTLDPDGSRMTLAGCEFHWPLMNRPIPFGPFEGKVLSCSTQAEYEMPLLGTPCLYRTFLDGEEGRVTLDAGFFGGEILLEEGSLAIIRQRRSEETA
jgi:hypothetical protein